jgi:hypothetical protein
MACVHVVTDDMTVLPRGAAFDYGITIVPRRPAAGAPAEADPTTGYAPSFAAGYQALLEAGLEVLSVHSPTAVGGAAEDARAAASVSDRVTVVEAACAMEAVGMLCLRAAYLGQEEAPRQELVDLVDAGARGTKQWLALRGLEGLPGLGWTVEGPAGPPPAEGYLIVRLADGAAWVEESVPDAGAMLRGLAERAAEQAGVAADGAVGLALASVEADAEAAALGAFLESMLAPVQQWRAHYPSILADALGAGAVGLSLTCL